MIVVSEHRRQRLVEGSIEGRTATAPFFAARPGQIDAAVGSVLDQIASQSPTPSVLGPRAADAATNAVRQVEQQRTAAVEPLYRAANPQTVPADAMNAILQQIGDTVAADRTGVLGGILNELRDRLTATPARPGTPASRTPVLNRDGQIVYYNTTPAQPAAPAVPITDIENLDRARKYFRDRLDLPQIGQDAITKEQGAAVSSVLDQLDRLMEASSPEFAAGKARYADLSRNVVQPVAEGPLGGVAAAKDTTAAGNAILPQNPLVGSEGETADAVRRLVAEDPDTTSALVRQIMGDRYAKAATETQAGSRDFAGAKFHKDIAGNPQREATLDAVLGNLPNDVRPQMNELLDVLQATGRRMPIGSATAFNNAGLADLGSLSPFATAVATARTLGGNILTSASDAAKRAAMRNSLSSLGRMFVDPQSVELIRDAMSRSAPLSFREAIPRGLAQGFFGAGDQR